MSLVYRSLFAVPPDHDVPGSTSAVLSEWLRRRGTAGAGVDFGRSGAYELSARSRALVLLHENREEDITFLRLTTESDKADGLWRTTVTAVSDPRRLDQRHVWVDVTVDSRAGVAGRDRVDAAAPDAVRMLLGAMPGYDGEHRLPPAPWVVRGRDSGAVRSLVDAIGDPRRRLAIIATAAPADTTAAEWRATMTRTLSRSAGMCAGYVLDAAAQEQIDTLLPPGLDVPPGGVRTFLPNVEFHSDADRLRHPRMSAGTLDGARQGRHVRAWVGRALSRSVRDNALDSPLPEALSDIDTLLNEEGIDAFIPPDGPEPAASPRGDAVPPDAAHPRSAERIELLDRRLREKTGEAKRLGAEAKRLSTYGTEQARERERLAAELNDVTEELDTARESLHAARHELAWLRGRLHAEGHYRLAAEPAPPDPELRPPRTVEDLLERITDGARLPHLYFTIEDRDTVHELTGNRKEKLWVARAWEALLALNDYAAYQLDHTGGGLSLHAYLREPPDGYHAIPVRRLASGESESVRNRDKLSAKRMFTVPKEVHPDGEVPMFAHIKLDTEYGICPRLYFYPHLGPRTTNRVYIGYLGRHLPVQRTN